MTNILLSIIAVLLIVRIVLQVRQGKRAVEHRVMVCNRSQFHIRKTVELMAADRWELVTAHRTKNGNEILYFTRKKIKNYYEE